MSRARLTGCVMLPFAAGYFLSYLFRTINAVIANDLAADLHLGTAGLGFLTSIYFLVFAAVQLPFGALLDADTVRSHFKAPYCSWRAPARSSSRLPTA